MARDYKPTPLPDNLQPVPHPPVPPPPLHLPLQCARNHQIRVRIPTDLHALFLLDSGDDHYFTILLV